MARSDVITEGHTTSAQPFYGESYSGNKFSFPSSTQVSVTPTNGYPTFGVIVIGYKFTD